jgi:lipoprotein-anchoring transpeptidase ErfK/SrfK
VGAALALVAGAASTSNPPAAAAAGEKASHASAPRPIASRPTTRKAWTARVLYPVWSRKAPRRNAKRAKKLSPLAPYNRGAQTLLVLGARTSRKHGVWYKVRLPFRPNTATGWVPAAALKVRSTPWRVKIDISQRRAWVFRNGKRKRSFRVVVGRSAFPTPTGRFAISEVVKQRSSRGFFGPYILTLSAHSQRLNFFDGGRGRVALHGTSRPGLLGSAASHGCVRFGNGAINYIGRRVPPGTPVDIVA